MKQNFFRMGWLARAAALSAMVHAVGIRADVEDPVVAGYRERQSQLVDASETLIAAADAERRELTTEERRTIRDNSAEVERLEEEITLRNNVRGQNTRLGSPAPGALPSGAVNEPLANSSGTGTSLPARHVQTTGLRQPNARAQGNFGFRSMVDFSRSVMAAARGQGMDPRLQNAAASTFGNETSGADGGFAVPPDFRNEIQALVMGEDSLFGRLDALPTASNSVTVPVDETTAWGTSGVRVYSRAEAVAMTQSKPALKDLTVRLHEIYALVPLTDELLEDAPLLNRLITTKAGDALSFKLTDYVINGTGAGQPLGIMNSGALVTVSKESSQAAASIHALNIAKMWARMPARARASAVWLANQDCEAAMMELGFQVQNAARNSATGGVPLFVPPGGLSAQPYSTLLGRPVITTEACQTIGTTGDLILASLGGYFLPYKAGGIKESMSMHLWFDQALTAFRWTFRFGGQPWLSAPIARKNGSNTLSTFVALETR